MKLALLAGTAMAFGAVEAASALTWNVSVWGKRRAFTEHIHKLGDLVAEKTGGEFTFNISYGGLSNNKENLDNISFGAIE
ncbi:MAG: C4-dicarboxylate ABC transporter substrate-binding protein, partial [Pseudomonadota bacterium]